MPIVIILVLLVLGSVLFHFLSPWWFTPLASNWGTIDDTVSITFWVTGIVFIAVNLFMAYAVYRFRYKADKRAEYEPENSKLEWWLTGLTTLGVIAMLAPGLFVWGKVVTVPEGAAEVEAVGQQWRWSYRYPGKDGKMGSVDAGRISNENPFGMNPDDPYGQDDILISTSEMHLPIDKPVKMLLRSKDVLHDFAVAEFRVKMDLVPGMVTYIWFIPTKSGNYDILCEELCGVAHFAMRGTVVVQEQREFQAWLDAQPTYAQILARDHGDAVIGQAQYAVCATCHGANGEGNQAMNAPKLAGQEPWYLRRQLENYKKGIRGTHEKDIFGKLMAPMAATLVDDNAIDNVTAYIKSLPDHPASVTIQGDAGEGEEYYQTCKVCHGKDGSGIELIGAPRLTGMSDWYLQTQINNFRHGVRGSHRSDVYGAQMASMVLNLNEDQSVNDLIAYIHTLQ